MASQDGNAPPPGPRYAHDALLYDSPDGLAAALAPFVREGLDRGEAVVVAAFPGTADVVRNAVGEHRLLHVIERSTVYSRRTPTTLTSFRRLIDDVTAHGAARARLVGEVDFGRTERDWLEWQRYEAVVNAALSPWPLWALCVFDTALPDQVLDSVVRTHPTLVTGKRRQPSPRFEDPAQYLRELPTPAEPLQRTRPRLDVVGVSDFIGLRHAVAAELAVVGGPSDVVEDFLVAVDEMTSNAVRHGAPPVDLRLWTSADKVVCTITDSGPGIDDPFAGYGPAHGEDLSRGGMGLWLARQLCDHVDITPGDPGVTVRLTTRLR